MTFDDNTLIAYLDGQLPDHDYGPLEQAMKHDAALLARLQALADSSELARRAFDPVLLEPVPPPMIAAIWRSPDPRVRRPHGGTGAAPARRLLAWLGPTTGPRAWPALVPVVLLGLGMVIGWQLQTPDEGKLRSGAPVTDQALALALEVSPSGHVLRTAAGAVEILATFDQAGGGHCREFNRSSPGGTRDELGVACRDARGEWQLDFLVAEHRAPAAAQDRYQTASDRQQEQADAFLRDRVQGPPLAESDEHALIARGWQR